MKSVESQAETASEERRDVVENKGTPRTDLCFGKPPWSGTIRYGRRRPTRWLGRCGVIAHGVAMPGRGVRSNQPTRAFPALLAALALASCTTPGKPQVVYQPVLTPVATSCVPAGTPNPPQIHSDADLKALDGPTRYVMTAADRKAALGWIALAAPVIAACRS